MEIKLTESLKISIFDTVPARLPAFNVSPAHERASIVFSFFLSFIEPMLSHPLVVEATEGGAAASESENMAIFCFLDFAGPVADVDLACCCGSSRGAGANGSTLAARAARTRGKAGDDGSSSVAGRASSLC